MDSGTCHRNPIVMTARASPTALLAALGLFIYLFGGYNMRNQQRALAGNRLQRRRVRRTQESSHYHAALGSRKSAMWTELRGGVGAALEEERGVEVGTLAGKLWRPEEGENSSEESEMLGIDGVGTSVHFVGPYCVAAGPQSEVYVSDTLENRIRKISLGLWLADRSPGFTGNSTSNLPKKDSEVEVFEQMTSISLARLMRQSQNGEVIVLAGSGEDGDADGSGLNARFRSPHGLCVSRDGTTIYVADSGNNKIRRISSDGEVTTVKVGNYSDVGSRGGERAQGAGLERYVQKEWEEDRRDIVEPEGLFFPMDVALDETTSRLLVADTHSGKISQVDLRTGNLTLVAGSFKGKSMHLDGLGSQAAFQYPISISLSKRDRILYVADPPEPALRVASREMEISKIEDIPEEMREIYDALQKVDADGVEVDWKEARNHFYPSIRAIYPNGKVVTLSGGKGSDNVDGYGSEALFICPTGVCVDQATGHVYVTDRSSRTIRKVSQDGETTTFCGSLEAGSQLSCDGSGSSARFLSPFGIAWDPTGYRSRLLYVPDLGERAVRVIMMD